VDRSRLADRIGIVGDARIAQILRGSRSCSGSNPATSVRDRSSLNRAA